MQRFQWLRWCDWLSLLLMLQTAEMLRAQFTANNIQNVDAGTSTEAEAAAAARRAQNAAPYPTYFFMDQNGSYKYAFETGSGIISEQSANQANEVTGQYSYFENGVPYMVKYKAGVQGYQAEIIPTDNLATATAQQQQEKTSGRNVFEDNFLSNKPKKLTPIQQQRISTNNADNAYRQQLDSLARPIVIEQTDENDVVGRVGGEGTVTTLQFVQDAMQTMRNRPLQVSFTSQQGFVLPTKSMIGKSGSFRLLPQSIGPAPVTNEEIQQINALAENTITNNVPTTTATVATQLKRHPYEFSYLSQQSSRSESADKSGNVVGKYSYYDDAGFHDLTYKAGDDIGFVVLGGSLAERRNALVNGINDANDASSPTSAPAGKVDNTLLSDSAFLVVNVSQQPNVNYNYRVVTDAPTIDRRTRRNNRSASSAVNALNNNSNNNNIKSNNNGRSLRKFQRNTNW